MKFFKCPKCGGVSNFEGCLPCDRKLTKTTMKIIIKGRPCSKKNSRRNYGHVSLPSLAYMRFHDDALWQLKKYHVQYDMPVKIHYSFKQKGKLQQDVDNAIASINDVLEDSGILLDDNLVTAGSFEKRGGFKEFETELDIINYKS